jgi:hypothetical protein
MKSRGTYKANTWREEILLMTLRRTTNPVGVTVAAATTASEVSTAVRAASSLEFPEEARIPEDQWFPTSQARRHHFAPPTAENSVPVSTVSRARLEHRQTLNRLLRSPPPPEMKTTDSLRSHQPPRSSRNLPRRLLLARAVSHRQQPSSATADRAESA